MKKIKFILFLLFIVSFSGFAQNKNAQILIDEGVKLHDDNQYKQAVQKFEEALKINPQSTRAMYELALTYLHLKDYRNASKFSTQVINSNDKNLSIGAYTIKSESLVEMNKTDDAIVLLQEGLRKNGDNYLMHFNLALNYYKKNDLDKTLQHVQRAIELNKTNSGSFLLDAYVNKDKTYWVKSILSFQMFLLLEPDSRRSKNAYEEMLQTMLIKPATEKPVERSFIQQQLMKDKPDNSAPLHEIPPLSIHDGLNRNFVYHAITSTMDSLKTVNKDTDLFIAFQEVNRAILQVLEKESRNNKDGNFWSFYVPFFSSIVNSNHYDTYCRYISVSYFDESMDWWQKNKLKALEFIHWFEKGDNIDK